VTLHYCDSIELVRMVAAVRTTVSLVTCTLKFCLMNARIKKSHNFLSPAPPVYCISLYTWSDSKVRDLATVCLPRQHWAKALVWFDDDISAFHSCVVVDL